MALLGWGPGRIVIVFRGTNSLKNVAADLQVQLLSCPFPEWHGYGCRRKVTVICMVRIAGRKVWLAVLHVCLGNYSAAQAEEPTTPAAAQSSKDADVQHVAQR